jgi:sugar/nucleoside kinase (ribokinase family)
MTQRSGILTAGSWCVDNNKSLLVWPSEDTMSTITALDRQGGGSGSNMAFDLKRLDSDFFVETMGIVGDDSDGQFLIKKCDEAGIKRDRLAIIKGGMTAFTDCFNAMESGKRTHLYFPGVADALSPDDFDFSTTTARLLHLGLPGAHKTMDGPWGSDTTGWATVLKAAQQAGLKTNLEMVTTTREKVRHFGRSALPYLDLLIVNDFEIGAVADVETRDGSQTLPDKIVEALRKILDLGPVSIAAAHFPEAAIALSRDGHLFSVGSVAIPPTEIAGVNGAGDAFAAGFLYYWHEGYPVDEALRFGHATAACSMREVSTTAGVVSVSETWALAKKWGFKPSF